MEGIERIKVLSSEVKDKALLKIVDYLTSREDMNEKYLNEEKTLKQMIEFIKSEARKQAENGIAMIEDEEVYGWSIHYWDESNKDLKLETKKEDTNVEVKEKNEPKPLNVKLLNDKKKWTPEGQLSIFDF